MSKKLFSSIVIAFAMVLNIPLIFGSPADAAGCTSTVLRYKSTGSCVKYAQQLLVQRGHTVGSAGADGIFGNATVNATLNFQRSQRLYDDGVIGSATWARLLSPVAVSSAIPRACKTSGIVLCANQATRKLYYVRGGVVRNTIPVRFGGWTRGTDGAYRIYRTTKGTYSVYKKVRNDWSNTYQVSMPYSLRFNGGQYVHYSSDFARNGYAGASHGCINVGSTANASWLYNNTPLNTRVVVY